MAKKFVFTLAFLFFLWLTDRGIGQGESAHNFKETEKSTPSAPVSSPIPSTSPIAQSTPSSSQESAIQPPAPNSSVAPLEEQMEMAYKKSPPILSSHTFHGKGGKAVFIAVWKKILAHYPELKKKHAKLSEAIAQKALAESGYYPRLYGWADSLTSDNPILGFMMHLTERNFTAQDFNIHNLNHPGTVSNQNAGLLAIFPIFDAMQTIDSVKAAKDAIKAREEEERYTRMEASLLSIDAWIGLLFADAELFKAMSQLEASKTDLNEALQLMEQGLVLGADFFMGRSLAASIEQSKNGYLARKKVALVTLNTLAGTPAEAEIAIPKNLPRPKKISKPLSSWVQEAILYRSDLAALRHQIQVQRTEVKREKDSIMPNVNGFASGMLDSDNFTTGGRSYTVGVLGTMALFDPSRDPKIKRAKAEEEQLIHEESVLKDNIQTKLAQAITDLETAYRDSEILYHSMNDAIQAIVMTRDLYREGRKTIADLIQARTYGLQVEISYLESVARYESSKAKLFFLSGQLDDYQVQNLANELGGEE
ncbi:TolC family protein [Candidatus Methylacidiphilum fumarolicum]|uniref:Outer membrane protein n=2 Tax=Candidatus Methylacidiphilum fumarolicum TaxID=591154 RepID=I0JXL9_METFB|nr:TolC family protein [Candidatus Methylacidiphilum fumarolicum]MBW6415873.1 TolC family protein [Candidatus Methylacidiphilum fumarolicum]TFE70779.1 hypothetical protein A7K73_03245 [Candidatus Methylacidiphilum fumarolicum]TFE71430.1 TolC family protein [Candidatus Methylacidiphilum fumarolicum]TFE74741.1 TolC family protein [Candidatus Methylacidiphilum fumarolicum]TFE76894.1 hypothetical protein A7D33_07655 [Candidatus Methylacidiphilum fumarolicum]